MYTEYDNIPFEEPSFIQNMDSNMKSLLETFMILDEHKMLIVLKQFYRIVKLLRENKDVLKSTDKPEASMDDIDKQHYVSVTSVKNTSGETIKMGETEEPKQPSIEIGNVHKREFYSDNQKETIEKKMYSCELCETIFTSKDGLKKHRKVVHSVKEIEEELMSPMKCKKHCNKTFTKMSVFLRHQYNYKDLTICPTCGKSFAKARLGLHIFNNHTPRPFQCEHCDHRVQNKELLAHHIQKSHEGPGYQCEFCDFWDPKINTFSYHQKSVHEGIQYDCNECDYNSKGKNNLDTHISAVHRNKTFNCQLCDYFCKDKRYLLKHKRSFHNETI